MNTAKSLTLLLVSTLWMHSFPDFRVSMLTPEELAETLRPQKTTAATAVLSRPVFSEPFLAPDRLFPTPRPTATPTPSPSPTPTSRPTPAPTRVPLGNTSSDHAGELTFTYPETAALNTDTSSYTFLVNKEYPLSSSYIPFMVEPEVDIYHKGINERRYLQPVAATALEEMFAAAEKDGYHLVLRCGFRSYKLQKSIYSYALKNYGYYEASRYHALPGTSEHQTGLAIDLCCKATNYENNFSILNTPEYAWLLENAHKYGWILRYPENKTHITGYGFEPWHFRYVGLELATYIKEQDITLEEYYGALPSTNLLAVPKEYWSLLSKKEFELMKQEQEEYEKRQEELAKQPTPTPDLTVTPDLTGTPMPTPDPAEIPDLTGTPVPTPDPAEIPDLTGTPVPTPDPADVPDLTGTPVPTPDPADVPDLTGTPVPTPDPADVPDLTGTPVPTPDPADVPDLTGTPVPTPDPAEIPDLTDTPDPAGPGVGQTHYNN